VISNAARQKLSDAQFEVLTTAAEETLNWSIANVPSETTKAATFCTNGGTIVAATNDQIESLHAAAQPVIDSLREDAATAAIIDAIDALKQDTVAAEPITSCEDVGVTSPPPATTSALNGTYTNVVTLEDTRAIADNPELLQDLPGTRTWTLVDGTMTVTKEGDAERGVPPWPPTRYEYDGTTLKVWFDTNPNNCATVTVVPTDSGLDFTDLTGCPGSGAPADTDALDSLLFNDWTRVD